MDFAPIALFVYNRLEHTKKTIEALKKNEYSETSELYVYSDGPKDDCSVDSVGAVREFLKGLSGFKSITIIEREKNFGLAENIISGVSEVINRYGKIIVLEDDIVTSRNFLKFMNSALEKYSDTEEVMSISGYISPIEKKGLPESFFLPWFECWGWATWKRSWDAYERNPFKLVRNTNCSLIKYVNINGMDPTFWDQVIRNYNGKIKTWAIFFHVIICEKNGLVLYPKESLCCNTGFDGTGENCNIINDFDVSLCDDMDFSLPNDKTINQQAVKSFEKFCCDRIGYKVRFVLWCKRIIYNKYINILGM